MDTAMVLSIVYVSLVLGLLTVYWLIMLFWFPDKTVDPTKSHSLFLVAILKFFTIPAAFLSWSTNASVWWATVHGSLGWIYLIYHWLGYGRGQ